MTPAATAPREARCTYQPCRNFERPVHVDASFACHHGERCPFAKRPDDVVAPPSAVRRLLAVAALLSVVAAAAVALWQHPWAPDVIVPSPGGPARASLDFDREIRELVSFSRQVLEKTDAIRVFEEQLYTSAVAMPDETRRRWLSAAERKRVERTDLCNRMIEKLGHLFETDPTATDREFLRYGAAQAAEMDRDDRLRKSVSLAQSNWARVKQVRNLHPQELIATAETLMPF